MILPLSFPMQLHGAPLANCPESFTTACVTISAFTIAGFGFDRSALALRVAYVLPTQLTTAPSAYCAAVGPPACGVELRERERPEREVCGSYLYRDLVRSRIQWVLLRE